jgi:acetyltransferase-like isoleucine patch superfamily enzyme
VTHIPSHNIRIGTLRAFGAKIGKHVSILRGTTILGIGALTIGDAVDIGFRCLLDARGGLTIGSNVVIASDVQFIAGHHLPNSDTFDWIMMPTVVHDYAWIASRATVLPGVTIGRGAVVGACSLVRKDVADMEMVAGVPAIHRGVRESALNYHPDHRPLFF